MLQRATRRVMCRIVVVALGSAGLALLAAPAGAVVVSTEAQLQSAFANAAETTIVLSNSIDLTCGGGGDLERNSATPLTIDGQGFTIRQTCAGERVMEQVGTGALTLTDVTITGGTNSSGNGGGILSSASVTLTDSVLTGNTTAADGGGIAVNGSLTITRSAVTNNTAGSDGGGAFVQAGALTVTDSTFSANTATGGGGGAVFRDGSGVDDVLVVRSTFSDNQAPQGSGAMDSLQGVSLINSTVTGNSGAIGGVSVVGGEDLTLVYTTIVANTSSSSIAANVAQASGSVIPFGSVIALPAGGPNCILNNATTTSNGFNFSDDATCGLTGVGDTENGGDPGLGPLADNGGPTLTRLPAAGSPLIDAIPTASCQADGAAGLTTDQRGLPRPAGGGCDIGAVEVQPPTPEPATPVTVIPRFTG